MNKVMRVSTGIILFCTANTLLYAKNINNLNELTTPKVVSSLGALRQLSNPKKNTFAWVAGLQGGYFRYLPTRAKEADGCTVFDGWARQTQEPAVNIMWCGAVGDGKTDDTEAFHKALQAAYRYRRQNRSLYLPTGTYRIKKKTIIPALVDGKKNNFFTIYGDGSFNAGQTQIYFEHPATGKRDDTMEYWIDSKILALTLKDIRFKQLYPRGKNIYSFKPFSLLRAKATKGNDKNTQITGDTDTAIMNCTFTRFYTVVENWGRGLRFNDNTASLGHNPIVLEWDVYPESPKGIGKDLTGFRAFNITGNRFHSNGGFAITNVGKNAHKIHSVLISDSLLDIGRGVFRGVLVDGSISNTVSIMTPTTVIDLHSKSKNYQINGLTASGNDDVVDNEKERIPKHFIVLRGDHSNGQFNNINLSNCSSDAVWSIKGSLNGVAFNNFTMNRIGTKPTDRLFAFAKYPHKVTINNLLYSGVRKLLHPIKAFGKNQSIIVNNYFSPNSSSMLKKEDGIRIYSQDVE